MAGKFYLKSFSDINLSDPFFDSLKADYPGSATSTGFIDWFYKKSAERKKALVFEDESGIGAFICLKAESEPLALDTGTLPNISRMKISTIKIAERYRGQRLGEGALGLSLWKWRDTQFPEIYVTVFDKQDTLIALFEKFGFIHVGNNANGERVYLKSRSNIDYSDAYKAFPFINPDFENAGYLIIDQGYHDTMFPYSELHNTLQESVALNFANGLSKIYVGSAAAPFYKKGDPIFIYRKHTGNGVKRYKSCLTSYCIVTDVISVKRAGRFNMTLDELLNRIGNKSVYSRQELTTKYHSFTNMTVIEMLYCGYFGAGNNVNMDWLDNNGCWSAPGQYPTSVRLSQDQFKRILTEGNVDVDNVIIN